MSRRSRVVFKPYAPDQLQLLPPSLDELISSDHPVRTVRSVIDSLDLTVLERSYRGGGTSSYHPRMLLKVMVYGYLENIYSSRKLEAAVQQNIHFMWLSGMSRPDHNTINRFRSERLKGELKNIFSQIVLLLVDQEVITLKQAYLDGTKLESSSNRYTFVWSKSIKTSKTRIKNQLDELWSYAESVAKEELKDTSPTAYAELDPAAAVEATIDKINEALKDKPIEKKSVRS